MIRHSLVAAAALVLAGCASFSPDGGMTQVSALTKERTGQSVTWQRSASDSEIANKRIDELLSQPLTVDSAVELALLNNRGLQANLADLGIAEADFVQAGRVRNPLVGFTHLAGGGALEIDRSVMFGIVDLLTLPAASSAARVRFEQAQYQAAYDAVSVAGETRLAYFDAVADQQLVTYFAQVKDAAEASNELARRMVAAGNFSRLEQMREQSFYADATAQLARARQRATDQRERLTRLLGLAKDRATFELPERLPDLPKAITRPGDVEQTAMDKRLDLLMAKRKADATARELGLTKATRFVNALGVGYANKSQTSAPRENGYEVQVAIPLFDFGAAGTVRAQARYMQAVDRAAEVAVNAQSETRAAYSAYRTNYDLAKHYQDEVVPLRKRISEENMRRYNGMLISVFELITDAREQVAAMSSYVESLRAYWIADANLQTALAGRSPGASMPSASR